MSEDTIADSTDTLAGGADVITPADAVTGADTVAATVAGDDMQAMVEAVTAESLKAPEGFDALDTGMVDKFIPLVAEYGLKAEQAQKLTDLYAQGVKDIQAKANEYLKTEGDAIYNERVDALATKWATDSKADPEIGGDKFKQFAGDANKAFKAFGNEGLDKALKDTGFGNHPEFIRMFAKIGALLGEDGKFINGNAAASNPHVGFMQLRAKHV